MFDRDFGNFEGKMKWHYFLGFFWLWLCIFLDVKNYLNSKANYNEIFNSTDPNMQRVLREIQVRRPKFKSMMDTELNMILVMIVITFIAAVGLVTFKKFGAYCVILLYLVNMISTAAISRYVSDTLREFAESTNTVSTLNGMTNLMNTMILWSVFMLVVNIIYFSKRLHLYD